MIFVVISHQPQLVVLRKSLRDCKFPQISGTLLRILANRNKAVVWRVSILALISYSSNLFSKSLGTTAHKLRLISLQPSSSIAFFSYFTRSNCLSLRFYLGSTRKAKLTRCQVLLSWKLTLRLVFWPKLVFVSKSQGILYVSFTRTDFCLYMTCFVIMSNFSFWHNS